MVETCFAPLAERTGDRECTDRAVCSADLCVQHKFTVQAFPLRTSIALVVRVCCRFQGDRWTGDGALGHSAAQNCAEG